MGFLKWYLGWIKKLDREIIKYCATVILSASSIAFAITPILLVVINGSLSKYWLFLTIPAGITGFALAWYLQWVRK